MLVWPMYWYSISCRVFYYTIWAWLNISAINSSTSRSPWSKNAGLVTEIDAHFTADLVLSCGYVLWDVLQLLDSSSGHVGWEYGDFSYQHCLMSSKQLLKMEGFKQSPRTRASWCVQTKQHAVQINSRVALTNPFLHMTSSIVPSISWRIKA